MRHDGVVKASRIKEEAGQTPKKSTKENKMTPAKRKTRKGENPATDGGRGGKGGVMHGPPADHSDSAERRAGLPCRRRWWKRVRRTTANPLLDDSLSCPPLHPGRRCREGSCCGWGDPRSPAFPDAPPLLPLALLPSPPVGASPRTAMATPFVPASHRSAFAPRRCGWGRAADAVVVRRRAIWSRPPLQKTRWTSAARGTRAVPPPPPHLALPTTVLPPQRVESPIGRGAVVVGRGRRGRRAPSPPPPPLLWPCPPSKDFPCRSPPPPSLPYVVLEARSPPEKGRGMPSAFLPRWSPRVWEK